MRLNTAAVHTGEGQPAANGPVVLPIHQTATFRHDLATLFRPTADSYDNVLYTRCNNNPSTVALARKMAELEGAELAIITSSGMAAIHAVLTTFLSAGDHLLVQPCLYGGTYSLVQDTLPRMGVEVTELRDPGDASSWASQLQPNTKMVYVETISNPLCGVPDLPGVVRFAREHKLLSVIDNTFASPANFRPVEHGYDLVVESATKYLNGHSDVSAGVVAGSRSLVSKVLSHHNHVGGVLDPHACFLLERGVKTLALRMQRQNTNALALAHALEAHPAVLRVNYPGLASHPKHELASRLFTGGAGVCWDGATAVKEALRLSHALQQAAPNGGGHGHDAAATAGNGNGSGNNGDAGPKGRLRVSSLVVEPGFGGVLSFELRGGLKAAETFIGALRLAVAAPSLGGVETLVTWPAGSSHVGQSEEVRAAMGVTDGVVRVACGIEDPQDLLEDMLVAAGAALQATKA